MRGRRQLSVAMNCCLAGAIRKMPARDSVPWRESHALRRAGAPRLCLPALQGAVGPLDAAKVDQNLRLPPERGNSRFPDPLPRSIPARGTLDTTKPPDWELSNYSERVSLISSSGEQFPVGWFCRGATGGNRTHTPLRAADFKSAVSTVPPPWHASQS